MFDALCLGGCALAPQRFFVQRRNFVAVKAVSAADDGNVALDNCIVVVV